MRVGGVERGQERARANVAIDGKVESNGMSSVLSHAKMRFIIFCPICRYFT